MLSLFLKAYENYKSDDFSKDLVFYTFFGVLEKITPFLIINLSALYFTPNIVGEYSYFLIIITLLSTVTSLELSRYVEVIYFNNNYEFNKSKGKLILNKHLMSKTLFVVCHTNNKQIF